MSDRIITPEPGVCDICKESTQVYDFYGDVYCQPCLDAAKPVKGDWDE